MAAPDFAHNAAVLEVLNSGNTLSNGTIGSPTAPTTNRQINQGMGPQISSPSNSSVYGTRATGWTALDFTAGSSDLIMMTVNHTDWVSHMDMGETEANNGSLRIYFEDSSGNYAGWWLLAGDWLTTSAYQGTGGSFTAWRNHNDVVTPTIVIDRSSTPDYSSGTVDWTDITDIEVHIATAATGSTGGMDGYVNYVGRCRPWTITAGDATEPCGFIMVNKESGTGNDPTWGSDNSGLEYMRVWGGIEPDHTVAGSGLQFLAVMGGEIGDGSTVTRFESFGEVILWCAARDTFEDDSVDKTFNAITAYIGDNDRGLLIDQSSTCYCELEALTMTGVDQAGGTWGLTCQGSTSGTLTIAACTFSRAREIVLAHAVCADTVFSDCELVEINGDTAMTGCVISNTASGAKGLYIQTAPADYSAIDVEFKSSNAGKDITINPSAGAGNFNLSGVTVESGHTLTIHNEHASTAITVEVAAGITTSTSTAGGTVTIATPPVTVQVHTVDEAGANVASVRVQVATDPGGVVVLEGLTNASGILSDTTTETGAVTGKARKTPTYKLKNIIGTIGASGYDATVIMIAEA